MLPYQYAYLLLDLLMLPIWVLLYRHRKDLRHKIVIMSILIGIVGPISELWYLQDYWKPLTFTGTPIGIEDFLFGFFIGGIGSVFYEELFGKKFAKRHTRKHHWALIFIIFTGICIIIMNILFLALKFNSIYTSYVAFGLLTASMIYFRKDLWMDAVVSGLLCGAILLSIYLIAVPIYPQIFERMWYLKHLSGYFVGQIPVEELLWAFGWGMVIGPLYEFYVGLRLAPRRR